MNSHFICAIYKMLSRTASNRMLHIFSIACLLSTIFGLEYTSTNLTRECMNDSKADDFIATGAPCTFYKSYSQTGKRSSSSPKRSQAGGNGVYNVKINFIPGSKEAYSGEEIIFSNEPTCKIVITHQNPRNVGLPRDSSKPKITVPCGELRHPAASLSNAIESSSDGADDDKITLYEKDIIASSSDELLTIRGHNLPSNSETGGGTYELIVSFVPGSLEEGIAKSAALLSRKKRQTYGYPTQRYYTSYNPYSNSYNTNYRTRSRVGSVARIGAGIIAAIVICCLLCCGLMTGLCFFCCCRGGRASENLPAWARGMPAVYRSDQPAPTHSGRAEAYDPAPQQAYPVYPKLDQNYGGQAYPVGTGGTAYYQGYPQARTENDPPGYTPSAPAGYPQR